MMTASFREQVFSQLPKGELDLRIMEQSDKLSIPDVAAGVVFVFAGWSGPAITGLRAVGKAIAMAVGRGIPLYVLDSDAFPSEYWEALQLPLPQGWGETYWVKDGRVVGTLCRIAERSIPEVQAATKSLNN